MTVLHLGVVDIPYARVPVEYKAHRRKAGAAGTATTGDVAEWLENKYHVMEVFFEARQEAIAGFVEHSLQGALESVLMGGPPGSPFKQAEADIDTEFRHFLSSGEIETFGIPGVPTKAAQMGVNHRKKSGFNRRKGGKPTPRPSFIDTGLYEASQKSWFDE